MPVHTQSWHFFAYFFDLKIKFTFKQRIIRVKKLKYVFPDKCKFIILALVKIEKSLVLFALFFFTDFKNTL